VKLTDRSARIEARIKWSAEIEKRTHAAEQIGDRSARIDHARRRVQGAADRAAALRDAGREFDLPASHDAIVVSRDAAAGLRGTAGAATPDAVLEDDSWRRLTKSVDDDAAALEASVRNAIDAAQARVRDLKPERYEATAAAQKKDAQFKKWTALRDSLLAPPAWYTRPAADLRQLLARGQDLVKGADELDFAGAPDNVRRFLDAARKGEAAIADLTPEIRRWLEDHALLINLRITLGAK
jgi:hypothetical protein